MAEIPTKILRNEINRLDEELVELILKRVRLISDEASSDGHFLESKKEVFSHVIDLAPLDKRDLVYNVYERLYAENSGFIETVARAVIVEDGKILLCKSKEGSAYYLPGGHVDFGETSQQALRRELQEEISCQSEIAEFLGVLENSFDQDGKRHQEVNLVYRVRLTDKANFNVAEPWIEYDWVKLEDLGNIVLLPEAILRHCK